VGDGVSKFLAADGSFVGYYPNAGMLSTPCNLTFDGTYIWANCGQNGDQYRTIKYNLDGTVAGGPWVQGDSQCFGYAFDGTYYWRMCQGAAKLRKYDAAGAEVGTGYDYAAQYSSVIYDGVGNIWLLTAWNPPRITKVRASDGANLLSFTLPHMNWYSTPKWQTCSDKTYIYVAYYDGDTGDRWYLYKVAIANGAGTLINTYTPVAYPSAVALDGKGNIWVRLTSPTSLAKIRLSDGVRLLDATLVENQASAICCDGTYVWVPNMAASTVRKIRVSDGGLVGDYGSFAQSPYPLGICHNGSILPDLPA
jgi:hypothetical protein